MARLAFCDYHNMIAILEKYEHNIDFHQIVDFVEASHLRYSFTINPTVYVSHIRQLWSTARIETTDEGTKILATVDGRTVLLFPSMLVTMGKGSGTPTEPHHTPSTEAQQTSPTATSSPSLPPVTTTTITTVIPTDTPHLRHYTRRVRIAQSSALPTTTDEPASPIGDDSQDLCTRLQRQQDEMASKITAQDLEISALKARIKHLEDRDGGDDEPSGEDAIIKGRRLETGDEAGIERSTEKDTNDTEEMANILTSLDAVSVLTSGVQMSVPPAAEVATISIPPVGEILTISVPTVSGMLPTASPIYTTATESTPYTRRKGKQKMVESDTPKKKKLQEQIDIQKGLSLEQESAKKVKTSEEVSKEDLKAMMQLVPVEEVYVEALQVKHPIIDWEIQTEGQRSYWKIIRLGRSTTSYQFFVDILKHFDREDLNQLWALVKETLNIRQAVSDKEKELWVELKRLYEPNVEDQLWTHTQTLMHDPVEWRLYDSCGVHHILLRDQEIFMLVEREYPLRKGLAIVMISNKLQVENYSQMASDLIQKIYKIANSPRQ
uniref:Xylulose kinase-1 n=1 Tax=Tanacetum cinerariifolium TaxID=118510 RepID=A0A6L2NUG4_TANCI|nr:hypothetical protein [Tanacetum cinerariifolium]